MYHDVQSMLREYPSMAHTPLFLHCHSNAVQYFSADLVRSVQAQNRSTKEEKGETKIFADMSFNK